MGREKLNNKLMIKGVVIGFVALMAILGGIAILISLLIINGVDIYILIPIGLIVIGLILMIWGIGFLRGEKSRYVKKNPGIFELADDLFENKIYEDDFMIVSQKAIAAKKDISTVADRNHVLAIYESIERINGIAYSHKVKLELANGRTIKIGVYLKKKETVDKVILTASHYCPNAALGYTGEVLGYVKSGRKAYKEMMANQT